MTKVMLFYTLQLGVKMKYLVIVFLMISCASKEKAKNSNHAKSNKYKYLQEFYKLRDQLKEQTEICTEYSDKNLRQVLIIDEAIKEAPFYSFKNPKKISEYLNNYNPRQFDWYLSAKIKNLYLEYPNLEEISKEHLEISNSLRDCSNEFDNLYFLYTALKIWSNKDSSKRNKSYAKKAFNRYFGYIAAQEVSLLNILATNSLLLKLEDKKLIKFKDKDKYLADSRELELLYTKAGQKILKLFQTKNYSDLYEQDAKLREAKKLFKEKMIKSYSYR